MCKTFKALISMLCIASFFLLPCLAAEPSLISESAVLIDADTGQVLYDKLMHEKRYPASITKIITAITGLEKLPLDTKIVMSHYAVFSLPIGSSHIALDEGEEITMEHALHAALMMSANDACNGIAEAAAGSIEEFAVMMNELAVRAGAKNSNFVNAHGLYDENHYTTAYDMAMICRYALQNTTFREVFGKYKYIMPPNNKQTESRTFINQHYMVSDPKLQYEGLIGGKAGWTTNSKYTLVTAAERNGRTIIAAVMKSPKNYDKYTDTKALFDYGFSDAFEEITITSADLPEGYSLSSDADIYVSPGTLKTDLVIETTMENGKDMARVSLRNPDGTQKELVTLPCQVAIDASADLGTRAISEFRGVSFLKVVGIVVAIPIVLFLLFVLSVIIRKKIYRMRKKRRRRKKYMQNKH